jgi:predicted nucleic acid-binding protein
MNVFFDTSSLFKLYHREEGTDALMELFDSAGIEILYLAEITRVEFSSVVWKKCRKNEIDENLAKLLLVKFEKDAEKFTFIKEDSSLKISAQELIGKHWRMGLRTLDALQLTSALRVKHKINLFLTADNVLSQIAKTEGFVTR